LTTIYISVSGKNGTGTDGTVNNGTGNYKGTNGKVGKNGTFQY